jgi:hypothetical protein
MCRVYSRVGGLPLNGRNESLAIKSRTRPRVVVIAIAYNFMCPINRSGRPLRTIRPPGTRIAPDTGNPGRQQGKCLERSRH